ncbi:MAG TPA: hypothetical protein VFN25_12470 [Dokdonella sp.]|uniref:hypothetical protein n=1 Tax=Dokdonella sp. TaxID=2291710 RepID=UPI002D7FB263|nr:hypothetical protein [Dokdonella sp.]HET9033706.1 hypothetical protein [Dokdonella sp.]
MAVILHEDATRLWRHVVAIKRHKSLGSPCHELGSSPLRFPDNNDHRRHLHLQGNRYGKIFQPNSLPPLVLFAVREQTKVGHTNSRRAKREVIDPGRDP